MGEEEKSLSRSFGELAGEFKGVSREIALLREDMEKRDERFREEGSSQRSEMLSTVKQWIDEVRTRHHDAMNAIQGLYINIETRVRALEAADASRAGAERAGGRWRDGIIFLVGSLVSGAVVLLLVHK